MAQFYLGQLIDFGGNFAIRGTAMCNGQLMPIAQNQALFAILGTTYGGDGVTTFGLPDLRGRDIVNPGQGSGLSNYDLGQVGGVENTTLTTNNLPAHTHTMTASMSASGLQPLASTPAPAAGSVLGHATDTSNNPKQAKPAIYCPSGTATPIALGGLNVTAGISGGSQPFSVVTPFLAITVLITLDGIFPTRN
jgi:microcystin-dependent protein